MRCGRRCGGGGVSMFSLRCNFYWGGTHLRGKGQDSWSAVDFSLSKIKDEDFRPLFKSLKGSERDPPRMYALQTLSPLSKWDICDLFLRCIGFIDHPPLCSGRAACQAASGHKVFSVGRIRSRLGHYHYKTAWVAYSGRRDTPCKMWGAPPFPCSSYLCCFIPVTYFIDYLFIFMSEKPKWHCVRLHGWVWLSQFPIHILEFTIKIATVRNDN